MQHHAAVDAKVIGNQVQCSGPEVRPYRRLVNCNDSIRIAGTCHGWTAYVAPLHTGRRFPAARQTTPSCAYITFTVGLDTHPSSSVHLSYSNAYCWLLAAKGSLLIL